MKQPSDEKGVFLLWGVHVAIDRTEHPPTHHQPQPDLICMDDGKELHALQSAGMAGMAGGRADEQASSKHAYVRVPCHAIAPVRSSPPSPNAMDSYTHTTRNSLARRKISPLNMYT